MTVVGAWPSVPVITSLSEAPWFGMKFASRAISPPPVKLPLSVRTSPVSPSCPMSRVALVRTLRVPASNAWLPAPNPIREPEAITTFSQLSRFDPGSVPETSLKVRVLAVPPPPSRAVSPPTAPPLKVSDVDVSASLTAPLMAAPLSTMTLSQPLSP